MVGVDGYTRLNVFISGETESRLRAFMEAEDVSATDAVGYLVGYGSAAWEADRAGKDVLVRGWYRTRRLRLVRPSAGTNLPRVRRHLRLVRNTVSWGR